MLDKKLIGDVRAFQRKFDIPMPDEPQNLEPSLADFRINFMQEELDEYSLAVDQKDLSKALDSLIDLIYVALGTVLSHGFGEVFQPAWNVVQDANMSKVRVDRPENGRHKFDVVKPAGWVSPDVVIGQLILAEILRPEVPEFKLVGALTSKDIEHQGDYGIAAFGRLTEAVEAQIGQADGAVQAEVVAEEGDEFTRRLIAHRIDPDAKTPNVRLISS